MISGPDDLTASVLEVMRQTDEPRLRQILIVLVEHLHSFIRQTKLTEDEFRAACDCLVRLGQQTNDSHNEVVLMAGSLGVSSLVCLQNNGAHGNTETTASLLGPFWRLNSPRVPNGGSILRSDTPGDPLFLSAQVLDDNRKPVVGADVDVWHASPVGLYENQDAEQAEMNLRGKFTTDKDGRFWFTSIIPAGYPIPTNGVVGELLAVQGRHPYRPAHVHFLIHKPGFKTHISQVFVKDTPYIDSDVQFGVTRALVGDFVRHDKPHPEGKAKAPWFSLDYTFVMDRGEAKLPRPPIK